MHASRSSNKRFSISTTDYLFTIDDIEDQISLESTAGPAPKLMGVTAGLSWQKPGERMRYSSISVHRSDIQQSRIEDVHGIGTEVMLSMHSTAETPFRLTWTWRFFDERPFALLRLDATNDSGQTLDIHDFTLFSCGHHRGGSAITDRTGEPPSFFKTGWHDWVYSGLRRPDEKDVTSLLGYFVGKMLFNPTLPIGRKRGEFWSDGWGILAGKEHAVLTGIASTADQFGVLHACCRPYGSALSLATQADGIPLEVGDTLRSEWGYIQFVELPCFDPAAEFVAAVAREMHPRQHTTPPPAKWTHWYHYFQSITDERFLANLDEIERVRPVIPFHTVQLDDGYQSAWGDWDMTNEKFPRGLGHLAARIREKGYTPGLWLAPFVVDPRSKIAQQHPDWLVKNKRGKPIRSGYFYEFFGHALDASHPGVQEHLYRLAEKIAHEWGFGFVKTDFTYAGALPGRRHDPRLTRAQVFRRGMQIIRKGLGEETFLLGCGCPFGPAIGIVDAMRIGPDTAPNWTPFLWSIPWAAPLLRNEKSVASLRNNMRHTLNLSVLHKRWWWNDPDCLMVRDYDTKLNRDEVISNITLIGLSGGQLVHSDDLTRLSPERRKLISLLTPILSQDARPIDLLEQEMPEIYDLPMFQKWGRWHVTAVFNWRDTPCHKILDLTRLGFQPGQRLHLFDFWRETYDLIEEPLIDLGTLPVHGCRLLRICQVESSPQIIGSTLHITQGGEVHDIVRDDSKTRIHLANLGRQVEGSLWIWHTNPMAVRFHEKQPPILEVGQGVFKIPVAYSNTLTVDID